MDEKDVERPAPAPETQDKPPEPPKKLRLRDKLAKLLEDDVNIYPLF